MPLRSHLPLAMLLLVVVANAYNRPLTRKAAVKQLPIKKGDFIAAFDNVLPPSLFSHFHEQLETFANWERPDGTMEANSPAAWQDLGVGMPLKGQGAKTPSHSSAPTLIEIVVKEFLAPLALGGHGAVAGFSGGDWWYNANQMQRDHPKEYHFDTGSNKAGIKCEPPTVSTVFFVRGAANGVGPTSVFDQRIKYFDKTTKNQIEPEIPPEIAMAFAVPNRLLVFHGNCLHGAGLPAKIADLEGAEDGDRLAFIVNYWTLDSIKKKVQCVNAPDNDLISWRDGGFRYATTNATQSTVDLRALINSELNHKPDPVKILRRHRKKMFHEDSEMAAWADQQVPAGISSLAREVVKNGEKWPVILTSYGLREDGEL